MDPKNIQPYYRCPVCANSILAYDGPGPNTKCERCGHKTNHASAKFDPKLLWKEENEKSN